MSFAKACWNHIISPLAIGDLPSQITLLQKIWAHSLHQANKKKNLATRTWNCIPSNLCWQIWIARNNCIFNNIKPDISRVIAKTTALITETIETNGISQVDKEKIEASLKDWINKFKYDKGLQNHELKGRRNLEWKLRGNKEEIKNWIQKQKRPTLHFDGASKINPGQAGAGGIIKDAQGKTIVKYEWGLGSMTNNKAEAYSLLLGISIARKLGLQNLLILGDSAIIIAALNSGKDFKQEALNRIKTRIMEVLKNINEVTFKHVLRGNNSEADEQANKATKRNAGQVKENDEVYERDIP